MDSRQWQSPRLDPDSVFSRIWTTSGPDLDVGYRLPAHRMICQEVSPP